MPMGKSGDLTHLQFHVGWIRSGGHLEVYPQTGMDA